MHTVLHLLRRVHYFVQHHHTYDAIVAALVVLLVVRALSNRSLRRD